MTARTRGLAALVTAVALAAAQALAGCGSDGENGAAAGKRAKESGTPKTEEKRSYGY
jgi:hypothetical protein